METILSLLIGGLFAAGIYSILRRSIVKLVIGLIMLSQSVNLLILTAAGLTRGNPPLLPKEGFVTGQGYADPLPQALVLTAIVISFGVISFTLVLLYRAHQKLGTDDLDKMGESDQ
ncbi:MAG: Na+/H+ antiporter subunit C [Calditrichaeota bacterium]|nr:Na+/H+ antiporter subunit C [Calditrichota bacterium]RQW07085.1 MAG: Na+/H+ antiporter subunit C [Calditrichota bacterium]